MNFFHKRKNTYIQNEYKKVYGEESSWGDKLTFQLVKMFYLGELLKLNNTKHWKRRK